MGRRALAIALTLVGGCGGTADKPAPRPAQGPPPLPPAVSSASVQGGSAGARFAVLGPEATPIDAARMAKYPEPGWNVPRAVRFAPTGKRITFLASEDGSEKMALFAFDETTRKVDVLLRADDLPKKTGAPSREEELRRERQRQRGEGVTSYRWARRADALIVPHGGDVFVRDGSGTVTRLTETAEPEIDPRICDTGERVAYVRKGELFTMDVKTKRERQLTRGAPDGVTRGLSDFNGQEEFGEESGHFWSPRCDRIAYLEVDERRVGSTFVMGYRDGREDAMPQRYPLAGGTNPSVRLRLVDVLTGTTRDVTWSESKERYLGRFNWSADGKALFLEALSRDQKYLTVVRVDATTGKATELSTDSAPTWVEHAPLRLLARTDEFLITTTVDGHKHLDKRRASDGSRVATLTQGPWDVESIVAVDESRGVILVTTTADGATQRQLYAVPLGGGAPRRMTTERGVHAVTADESGERWVDVHSAIDRAPRAVVMNGIETVADLPMPPRPEIAELRLRSPELLKVSGPAGELDALLLRPRDVRPGEKHPAIVMVYGGPGAQSVFDRWEPHLLWQHLADRGFFVLQVDNRGSGGRGPAFETLVHKKLGELELADQLAGADFLAHLPEVDGARIGIYGHSYGGFMVGMAMLRAPGRFAVGIAGSPVTDWRLYDTGYTERFMETPAQNPEGYAASTLASFAPNLRGKLLIVHSLMDENVHFTHTANLIDALVAAGKRFDLLVFPGERHGYRKPAVRAYVYGNVANYFAEHL